MRILVGSLCMLGWVLYAGQLVSVFNFGLAQRLGLQESPEHTDRLFSHVELWTARWDLCWVWTLPAAGLLMLTDHPLWPVAALIGGATFVDTGGREAAKYLGLRERGVYTGSARERRLSMAAYGYMLVAGLLAIAAGLSRLT